MSKVGEAPLSRPLVSGRYRQLDYAGRGSLGAVYRAFDAELGTTVALKTILDAGPDWIYRLKREFRTLRGVVHRNLAQLYDLVVSEDACFSPWSSWTDPTSADRKYSPFAPHSPPCTVFAFEQQSLSRIRERAVLFLVRYPD